MLEDQSLYWNDDKEIVDTFVLKTIKRFEEKNGANQELLPEFKDDEDQEFARRLFRRTILNADYYRHLVSENTKNWDLDRIAFMDIIIMQTALAEILSFPNIPVMCFVERICRYCQSLQHGQKWQLRERYIGWNS